jgi:acyl-CoA reductase-like NAD-dependent aldehyde dehydrogenase
MEEGVTVGPVISRAAVDKTDHFVRDALSKGARALTGGKRPTGPGYFYPPTVLVDVSDECLVMKEEIFGPVAPLVSFADEADVLQRANATEVGLAAYFYTRDISRAWRVAEALEVGMVGINTGVISTATAPFGGIKQSGFGREGSTYGLDEYMNVKYMMMGV